MCNEVEAKEQTGIVVMVLEAIAEAEDTTNTGFLQGKEKDRALCREQEGSHNLNHISEQTMTIQSYPHPFSH